MKIVLFGASGMVGQGVIRECLRDDDVTEVVSVVRKPTGAADPKLREVVHADFTDLTALMPDFAGTDACFYCLGVSAVGMAEDAYRRISFDFTLAAAAPMIAQNPPMTFIYVSGAGTNSQGRAMWARVKGETENALLALSEHTYMFRLGFVRPLGGATSKTPLYRVIYAVMRPLGPLLVRLPKYITDSVRVGRAMLNVAKHGYPKQIMENLDINAAS